MMMVLVVVGKDDSDSGWANLNGEWTALGGCETTSLTMPVKT